MSHNNVLELIDKGLDEAPISADRIRVYTVIKSLWNIMWFIEDRLRKNYIGRTHLNVPKCVFCVQPRRLSSIYCVEILTWLLILIFHAFKDVSEDVVRHILQK